MGTWLHGSVLLEWFKDLLTDKLKVSMGLKTVSHGTLYQLYVDPETENNVPLLFVSLSDTVPVESANIGGDLLCTYPVRVTYVRKFADKEKPITKEEALELIGNTLMDNRLALLALSLTQGRFGDNRITNVSYSPDEEGELKVVNRDLVAAALTYSVEVISDGRN